MVLSNKKLKQKLREVTENPNPTREALLKSKLRRREKLRQNRPFKTRDLDNGGVADGGSESEVPIKKRKREEEVKGEEVGLEEKKAGVKNKKKKKKKKNNKKKKKSEGEIGGNRESEKEEKIEGENDGNRESEEIGVRKVEADDGVVHCLIQMIEADYTDDGQDTGEAAMKVYVGGIPYYSSEDDIRSYFESCGTITEIDCMMFPESGKFRGIAILSFKTDAAAKRALALDGSDMGGLFLKVVPYKPTKAKKYSEDFAPSILEGYNRIYVGNLSWNITEDELKNFFYGCTISSIRFGEDKETKEFRGYAHVDFADSVSLNKALQLDQEIVCGRPVRVRCAVPLKNKVITGNTPKVDEKSEIVAEIVNADVAVVTPVIEEVSGKIRRRTCYECGEKGHLSSSCPNKKAADQANGGES